MNAPSPYRVIRQSSATYPVYLAPGTLSSVGEIVLERSQARRCVLISSRTVFGLYGAMVVDSLKAAGSEPGVVLMSDDERDKNLETVDYVVTQLINLGCQRD